MDDIKALSLVRQEIKSVAPLSNLPVNFEDETKLNIFEKNCISIIHQAVDTIQAIAEYVKEIDRQLEQLRVTLMNSRETVQVKLIEILNSITIDNEESKKSDNSMKMENVRELKSSNPEKTYVQNEPNSPKEESRNDAKKMEITLRLLKIEEEKQKILESIALAQNITNGIDNGIGATIKDVEDLKDSINSWMTAEKDKHKEDQRKRDENREKSENEEQRRNEDDEREHRIKEEEEQNQKGYEEEQLRKEEEDSKSKDEEDKRMKEKEEEERRERENKEKKRRKEEEEEKKRREKERLQKEEEERVKKQEEEKKRIEENRRRDPANWKPKKYKRPEEKTNAFHGGVCCQVAAMDGILEEEDLECLASDEWREKEEDKESVLNVDEKLASSIVTINANSGEKTLQVPMRVYVPHCSISDSSDEIVVKTSIDGGKWTEKRPISVPLALIGRLGVNYVGIDVSKFKTVKIVAVAKCWSQEFVVSKGGTSQVSTVDKNIKLIVPKDAFSKPCKLKLAVRQMKDHSLMFATQYDEQFHNVLSTSSVTKITCETETEKNLQLDLVRSARNDKKSREKRKYLHIYKCRGDSWNIADSEFRGRNMDVSVTLPSRKDRYDVMEIEGKPTVRNEEFLKAAEELYFHSNASIVQLIAKQSKQHIMMIECVGRERVEPRISELKLDGYSLGPDPSSEFKLLDGQDITLHCSGNIKMATGSEVKLTYHSYMDTAKQKVDLQVVDEFRQKDSSVYLGNLHFEVMRDKRDGAFNNRHKGILPLTLDKVKRNHTTLNRIRVRFPHYLTALGKFLAIKLTSQTRDDTWLQVIYSLDSDPDMNIIRRRADADNDREICELLLHDWMKHKLVQDDKVKQIIRALKIFKMTTLANECENLVKFHTEHLSNSRMNEMANMVDGDWVSLARTLGLSEKDVDKCRQDACNSNEKTAFIVLCKWRVSEVAITSGFDVFNDLLGRLENAQFNMRLQEYIRQI